MHTTISQTDAFFRIFDDPRGKTSVEKRTDGQRPVEAEIEDEDGEEEGENLVIDEHEGPQEDGAADGLTPTQVLPPPSAKPTILPSVSAGGRRNGQPGQLKDVPPPPMPAIPTTLGRSQADVEAAAEEAKEAALEARKSRRIVKGNIKTIKTSIIESMKLAEYYQVSISFFTFHLTPFLFLSHNAEKSN